MWSVVQDWLMESDNVCCEIEQNMEVSMGMLLGIR